jgi:AraC-like DNA-binding protein
MTAAGDHNVLSYREVPAPPALARWVEWFWELRPTPVGARVVRRVIPDGSADLVFHLGDVPALATAPAYVVGPLLRSVTIDYAPDTHVVGACLRPGGLQALLDVAPHDLTDRMAPLGDVCGRMGERLSDMVIDGSPHEAVQRLNAALCARVSSLALPDAAASEAVRLIRGSGGRVSVDALARLVALSPRHLERRFSAAVGMSPKVFARLARFDSIVQHLRQCGLDRGWATLAAEHGYHDQAHLAHEVRAFAGITPVALLAELYPVGFLQYERAATC